MSIERLNRVMMAAGDGMAKRLDELEPEVERLREENAKLRETLAWTSKTVARDALLAVAEELEADAARHDTNDGSTFCRDCGAPQAVPWQHDACPVAIVRARAEELR